jgi:hypothetical protein
MAMPAAEGQYPPPSQAGDPGVSEETRRAEREHFESVCRAFVYYREHGLQIIKKAEVGASCFAGRMAAGAALLPHLS